MMFYTLAWIAVFSLLALWSALAWALHAVTTWTVSNAGALAGGTGAIEGSRWPEWLAAWVPQELSGALTSLASALAPAVEAVLGWAPALAGGLSVAVWVAWGVGCVLLVVLGFGLTGLIALLRRQMIVPAGAGANPAAVR